MQRRKKQFLQYFIVGLSVVAGLVWLAVFQVEANSGLLRVHFFDVGQGDAIFIETPDGNQVLIDGGPDNSVLAKLGETMPFWDRSIDLVMLTHPHADHLDGLAEVLKRYAVRTVIESGVNHSIPEYAEWKALLKEKGVHTMIAHAGQRVRLSDSASIDILTPFENFQGVSPKDIHDAVIVSKLVVASTTILFMGDAERSLEYQLLASGADIDVEVLKVGHHGSKTSTAEDFLKAVSPDIAVISAGRKNRYGHPHQGVIDRLQKFGIKIFRTDLDGDIKFVADGIRIRVE